MYVKPIRQAVPIRAEHRDGNIGTQPSKTWLSPTPPLGDEASDSRKLEVHPGGALPVPAWKVKTAHM